jgi:exopolysaccharide biosynthesis polyprenyl glycosylphosphotransferase
MTIRSQLISSPVLFASTAGAKIAPDSFPDPSQTGSCGDNGWARQVPGNGSTGNGRLLAGLSRRWVRLSYVLIDVIFVSANGMLAFFLRFVPVSLWHLVRTTRTGLGADFPLKPYSGFLLLYTILIVLIGQSQDLYRTPRGRSAVQESWAVFRTIIFATIVLTAFIFCLNVKIVSREVVGMSVLLNLASLVIWRVFKRQFVTRRVAQGIGARNTLIVGAGEVGQDLAQYLERNKQLGYRVKGFLDVDHHGDPRILGNIEDLPKIARAQFVDEILITIPSERDVVKSVAAEGRRLRLNVRVVPELYDGLARSAVIHHMGDFPVMELHWEPIPTLGLFVKRGTDILLSALALVVLSPFLLFLAIVIKLDSPGPIFHKSKRVGRKGATFNCYKLRTMVMNAEQLKEQLNHLNERSNGMLFKIAQDPRITRLGKFLRKYSLDELPQLWNVLKGEMSLVGPRPPLPSEYDQYSLEHLRRLDVKPGVTGLWQVTARSDPSFENYMSLDLKYIESWGLWTDAKILWRTIPAVMKGQGL